MRVRVIVVTHQALSALKRCLDALKRSSTGADVQVLVVDSGSGPGVGAAVRALARRAGAEALIHRRNIGKAAAINRALKEDAGRSDWLAVLDDDALVPEGWIEKLLAASRLHPAAAIIGCRSVHLDGSVHSAEMCAWYRSVGYGEIDEGQRSYTRFCDAVVGVCLMIRRDAIIRVRFDEALHQTFEDSDFCYSARRAGMKVLYHGGVGVRHEHLARQRNTPRSYARMIAKWGPAVCFPDSHPLDRAYARLFAAHEGECREVIAACRPLLRLDPVPAYAWALSGLAYWELGSRREALRRLETAAGSPHVSPRFRARMIGALASARAGLHSHPLLCRWKIPLERPSSDATA